MLKNVDGPQSGIASGPVASRKNNNTHKCSFFFLTCLHVSRRWRKKLNVAILLDFSAVEPVAVLMRVPEGLLLLLPLPLFLLLPPLSPCRRSMLASPSAGDKLRTANFPVTSTAFRPVRIFSLYGSGPIMHGTIIDVGINYITAIRQG